MSVRSWRTHTYLLVLLAVLAACHSKKEIAGAKSEAASRSKYAALMGVSPDDLENKRLVNFLDAWYGVPYKYGGADRSGIDCSHLASKVLQDVYNKRISGTASDLEKMSSHVKEGKLREGDLVFFKIGSKQVSHVGIYIANHHFMHASTKKGVMISDLEEPYFKKHYYTGGRID